MRFVKKISFRELIRNENSEHELFFKLSALKPMLRVEGTRQSRRNILHRFIQKQ